MRPAQVTLAAAGSSQWIEIDYLSIAFGVGLGLSFSSGASATANVQHTFDGAEERRPVIVSRSGTTVSVIDSGPAGTGHLLSVNDDVILDGTGVFDGEYAVAAITSATVYTVTTVGSGTVVQHPAYATGMRVYPHASLTAATSRADGNYAYPIRGVRLNVSVYGSGVVSLKVLQGVGAAG